MGRHLHLDPLGGLAGDMLCGALLDLGADAAALEAALAGLALPGWSLSVEGVTRGAFRATWFRVHLEGAAADAAHDHGHSHDHGHDHDHGHSHSHDPGRGAPGPSRAWRDIRAMLTDADLPDRARDRALAVFGRLAEAEGRAHGVPPDAVTFHEVGALDSIIDIVGACLLLDQLDIDTITCAPLPLGSGHTRSQHGRIPLPAPATVELLRGWPTLPGPAGRECVTPTGAALVAALATPGAAPAMVLAGQGMGAGSRNPPDRANVVRALLGRTEAAPSPTEVVVVEAQVDDLPGEHVPHVLDALLAAGALDALAIPVVMKKGRPGLLLQALCRPDDQEAISVALLRHSGSFGVRRTRADRRVLRRWHRSVETPWGPVRVKVGALDDEILHLAPEHDDVAAVAAAAGVPTPRVHWAAVRAADPASLAEAPGGPPDRDE